MLTDIAAPVEKRTCTPPTSPPPVPARPAMDEALDTVQRDSSEDAQLYLDEVVAPYGGE